jgi:hypothetical protein
LYWFAAALAAKVSLVLIPRIAHSIGCGLRPELVFELSYAPFFQTSLFSTALGLSNKKPAGDYPAGLSTRLSLKPIAALIQVVRYFN